MQGYSDTGYLRLCLWVCSSLSTGHSSFFHIRLCSYNEGKRCHFSVRMKRTKSLSLRSSVPLLWSCLSSSSSPALWKYVKKRVAETMMWADDQLCSLREKTALRLGTLMVFVNQMLLMMAGDVEPNPGPGEGEKGIEPVYKCHTLCYSYRMSWTRWPQWCPEYHIHCQAQVVLHWTGTECTISYTGHHQDTILQWHFELPHRDAQGMAEECVSSPHMEWSCQGIVKCTCWREEASRGDQGAVLSPGWRASHWPSTRWGLCTNIHWGTGELGALKILSKPPSSKCVCRAQWVYTAKPVLIKALISLHCDISSFLSVTLLCKGTCTAVTEDRELSSTTVAHETVHHPELQPAGGVYM